MTKLCIIGYGKMGKIIAGMAPTNGFEVVSTIDPQVPGSLPSISRENLRGAEVCVEFSHPSVVLENIRAVAELRVPLVVGTTGWNAHLDEVSALTEQYSTAILHGANFSIGMNIFNHLAAYATQLCDKFAAYDVWGVEMHHNQKADSPSGTAIQLADTILANSSRKTRPVYTMLDRRIEPDELHFASVRGGKIPGTHMIGFDSEEDSITLEHGARSRACFAAGALQAAHWIIGRKGLFTFNQMMQSILC